MAEEAQAQSTTGAASATAPDPVAALNQFREANAAKLFSTNPDHGKLAEYRRLVEAAFPDAPDVPNAGPIVHQPAEDGLTRAANAAVDDVPTDSSDYKLDYSAVLEGILDQNLDSEFRSLAHGDLKLPQSTAACIFSKHNELEKNPDSVLSPLAAEEKLRAMWGSDFDRKMAHAAEVLGNDPTFLSLLAFLGEVRTARKR
jgi:hypothetical protein